MALQFYTSVTLVLKQVAIKFSGLYPMFVEVTGEKLLGESIFALLPSRIG